MADLRGASKLMSEIALVCTEKQFADLCANDDSLLQKEYVYMSSVQMRYELCGGVITGQLPKDSIAIVPNDCSALYLAFLLTSLPCQHILFDQKLNVKSKTKISKKSVSRLIAFDVDETSEKAYGFAESLKEQMYKVYKENNENLNYQHMYFIIADLCNILALELYAHPMFEEMGIFIVKNWITLVEEFEKTNEINIILDGLINSDSTLRNNIMKVHMFEDNFDKYIKEHEDGMANK